MPGLKTRKQGNVPGCTQDCQEPWETNGKHCYLWSDHRRNWERAEEFCRTRGGHLASVTSNATNQYILRGIASRKVDDAIWIGGTDKEGEGVWKWADGSSWKFSYWQVNRPSRNNQNQNCLQYETSFSNAKWWDFFCERSYKFLCSQKICRGTGSGMYFIIYHFLTFLLYPDLPADEQSSATPLEITTLPGIFLL